MNEIIKILAKSDFGLIIIGIGIGIAGIVFLIVKIIKFAQKYFEPLEAMKDDVIAIKAQTNGRKSMAHTLEDHETRVCLVEGEIAHVHEDVKEIKNSVSKIFEILDKRF